MAMGRSSASARVSFGSVTLSSRLDSDEADAPGAESGAATWAEVKWRNDSVDDHHDSLREGNGMAVQGRIAEKEGKRSGEFGAAVVSPEMVGTKGKVENSVVPEPSISNDDTVSISPGSVSAGRRIRDTNLRIPSQKPEQRDQQDQFRELAVSVSSVLSSSVSSIERDSSPTAVGLIALARRRARKAMEEVVVQEEEEEQQQQQQQQQQTLESVAADPPEKEAEEDGTWRSTGGGPGVEHREGRGPGRPMAWVKSRHDGAGCAVFRRCYCPL